jgi:hypothetical protein
MQTASYWKKLKAADQHVRGAIRLADRQKHKLYEKNRRRQRRKIVVAYCEQLAWNCGENPGKKTVGVTVCAKNCCLGQKYFSGQSKGSENEGDLEFVVFNFICFVIRVCFCDLYILTLSVFCLCTYLHCFVVIVVLCIFIFVCTSARLLPPGESPIAVGK